MKNILLTIHLIISICLVSCSESKNHSIAGEIYKVDLDVKVNPFDEIFSHAEVIPLETTDSCLIVYQSKVFPVKDKYYVYDELGKQKLFVFDKDGKFQGCIGRHGKGPGEYYAIYDCLVDAEKEIVYMLSVFGRIKQYSLNGVFQGDIILPPRPHYYSMLPVGDSLVATWSCMDYEADGVLLLNKYTGDTINGFWRDHDNFDSQQSFPFHHYNGKNYFSVALRPEVYEFDNEEVRIVYTWDFGKYNIRESRLNYYLDIEDVNKMNQIIIDDIGSDGLPFTLERQDQNSMYSYVALRRKAGFRMKIPMSYVFYQRQDDKALVFDYLDGNKCRMNEPLYFGENYILTDIYYDDRKTYKSILPESEYKKLEAMKEDDNPCLLKLYFKK